MPQEPALPRLADVLDELRSQLLETRVGAVKHPVRLEITEASVDLEAVVERSAQGSIVLGILGGQAAQARGTTVSLHITMRVFDPHGTPLQIADDWTVTPGEGSVAP